MDDRLQGFLDELAAFGRANDREAFDRAQKMLNITPDTGVLLWMLVRSIKPAHVLEIGTSNGYSTVWMADAFVDPDQTLTTLEIQPAKAQLARSNFARAGVASRIRLIEGDASTFLAEAPAEQFSLVFLDSERTRYLTWWKDLFRVTATDGLIVVDNAVDKAAELVEFRRLVDSTPGCTSVLAPLGNGELIILKGRGVPAPA